jgi:hypothetical protein
MKGNSFVQRVFLLLLTQNKQYAVILISSKVYFYILFVLFRSLKCEGNKISEAFLKLRHVVIFISWDIILSVVKKIQILEGRNDYILVKDH